MYPLRQFVPALIVLQIIFAACQQDRQQSASDEKVTRLGEVLTLSNITPVATILNDGETLLGQKVALKGQVTDVCPKKGCWIRIAGDRLVWLTMRS